MQVPLRTHMSSTPAWMILKAATTLSGILLKNGVEGDDVVTVDVYEIQITDEGTQETFVDSAEANISVVEGPYAISMTAPEDPIEFAIGDEGQASVTATLRYYKDGDTDEPTGNPVKNKLVKFTTSLGELEGENPAETDDNGMTSITVTSTTAGVATVSAAVPGSTVSGSVDVTFEREPPASYAGQHICDVVFDYEIGSTSYGVYIEFAKITEGDVLPSAYEVYGSGFNDTYWYGTEYHATGPPWPENAHCKETEDTFKVFLTGGSNCCWDIEEGPGKTEEEVCAWGMGRFEGAVWEITPVYD